MLKLFSDSFLSFAFACISERNISVDSLARHSLMPSLFISSFPLSVSFSFFSSFLLFHFCFFPFHFIVYIFFLLNISFSSFFCLSICVMIFIFRSLLFRFLIFIFDFSSLLFSIYCYIHFAIFYFNISLDPLLLFVRKFCPALSFTFLFHPFSIFSFTFSFLEGEFSLGLTFMDQNINSKSWRSTKKGKNEEAKTIEMAVKTFLLFLAFTYN